MSVISLTTTKRPKLTLDLVDQSIMGILLLLLGPLATNDNISLSTATGMVSFVGVDLRNLGNDIVVVLRRLGDKFGGPDIRSSSALTHPSAPRGYRSREKWP